METTEPQTFTADSAYASWDTEERAASDRVEAYFNGQHRTNRALAAEKAGHPVRSYTDAMLRSLAKTYRREIEDIESGDHNLPSKGNRSAKCKLRLLKAKVHDIECEQEFRAALAESWLATEDGTDSYTSFEARGGLAAVLHHGATPPSYHLAIELDRDNWRCGLPHVLDWAPAQEMVA